MNKTLKIFKKIGSIITTIILICSILILCVSVYLFVKNKDNRNSTYIFGYKPVFVLSGSMEPTIKEHSVVLVKQTKYEDVKLNDIIMFTIDDVTITHRAVAINDNGITTKGDNNKAADSTVLTQNNVNAKVVLKMNWIAGIYNDFQTTTGKIKWSICIMSIIISLFIIKLCCKKIFTNNDEIIKKEEEKK